MGTSRIPPANLAAVWHAANARIGFGGDGHSPADPREPRAHPDVVGGRGGRAAGPIAGCRPDPQEVRRGVQRPRQSRRLGISNEKQDAEERHTRAAELKPRRQTVRLLGRDIPVLAAADGTLRAEDDGKPAAARGVQSYIARAFGDRLGEARAAMEALASSIPPEELNRVGFRLYEQFRPDVPQGAEGWGAKGELRPERIAGAATALSVLRQTHDHHRNLPALDAAARAASLSRTNREDDAMTRHGSCPHRVVASPVRPSIRCVPIDTPVPLCTQIQDAIAEFACPWPRINTPIARQDLWNGDPEEHGEHQTHHPWHSQLLKSP
jgi:hypothetical protein